jgi:hypothetical protein
MSVVEVCPIFTPPQTLRIPSASFARTLNLPFPDGVLDVQIGHVLSQGNGRIHGTDNSPAMIAAAKEAADSAGLSNKCTFEGKPALTSPTPPIIYSPTQSSTQQP